MISVCVIQTSPGQKNPSLILLNHCQGSVQAGLGAFSLLWGQVSFGAGVETSFLWSRRATVGAAGGRRRGSKRRGWMQNLSAL